MLIPQLIFEMGNSDRYSFNKSFIHFLNPLKPELKVLGVSWSLTHHDIQQDIIISFHHNVKLYNHIYRY